LCGAVERPWNDEKNEENEDENDDFDNDADRDDEEIDGDEENDEEEYEDETEEYAEYQNRFAENKTLSGALVKGTTRGLVASVGHIAVKKIMGLVVSKTGATILGSGVIGGVLAGIAPMVVTIAIGGLIGAGIGCGTVCRNHLYYAVAMHRHNLKSFSLPLLYSSWS